MRKLASIRVISSITPHPNADLLEIARVDGWNVVVKKGEFKEGDAVVYCEIDSILPDKEWCSFLKKSGKINRIRPIRLRGIVSQGIVFPLSILPERSRVDGSATTKNKKYINDYCLCEDVTAVLEIEKYEPPITFVSGDAKGKLPSYVPKTDEERIQNIPHIVDEIKGEPYYITLKYDGTSATFAYKNGEFDICSRNISLKESERSIYWKIAKMYDLREICEDENITIQGEIYGESIQGNKLKIKGIDLAVFNVIDMSNGRYYNFEELVSFVEKYDLPMVKVIEDCNTFNYSVEDLHVIADGVKYGNDFGEGIVIRLKDQNRYSTTLNTRVSFKVINTNYILD